MAAFSGRLTTEPSVPPLGMPNTLSLHAEKHTSLRGSMSSGAVCPEHQEPLVSVCFDSLSGVSVRFTTVMIEERAQSPAALRLSFISLTVC
jgi:hypothetical protein